MSARERAQAPGRQLFCVSSGTSDIALRVVGGRNVRLQRERGLGAVAARDRRAPRWRLLALHKSLIPVLLLQLPLALPSTGSYLEDFLGVRVTGTAPSAAWPFMVGCIFSYASENCQEMLAWRMRKE